MADLSICILQPRVKADTAYRRAEGPAIAHITIDPRRVLQVLLTTVAILAIASTGAGAALYFLAWPEGSFGHQMVRLFWLDTEQNIPTLYQCSVMFVASGLLVLLGRRYSESKMPASAWYVLAVAFAFLGIDEGTQVHEAVGKAFGTSFGASWSFFYVPVVLGLGISLLPFLLRLPARTRWLLILSGSVFVGGSVGVEIIGQAYAEAAGKANATYAALATLEEVLEMFAIALLIFTLLEHLRTFGGRSARKPVPRF